MNRHMRAVWLEHSKHIIIANYKQRILYIAQAIALTMSVGCGLGIRAEDLKAEQLANVKKVRASRHAKLTKKTLLIDS